MCGRYTLITNIGGLAERFGFDASGLAYTPSHNIAPTQMVLTVMVHGERRASLMRWGLVPSWAKSPSAAPP